MAHILEVTRGEPAYNLREINEQGHRWQFIKVVRQQELVEWRRDLGPVESFRAQQFRIIGGLVDEKTGRGESYHTVGELQDMAEAMRNETEDQWPEVVSTNWANAYSDEVDIRRRQAVGRKVFQT